MLPSPHLWYESICVFYVLGHDSYFGRSSWVLLLMRGFPHGRSYKWNMHRALLVKQFLYTFVP